MADPIVNNTNQTAYATRIWRKVFGHKQNVENTSNDQSSGVSNTDVATVSYSADSKVTGEGKQKWHKSVFSIVVQYVAKPVSVGATWVAKQAVSGFKALTGLLQKTNETTAKINEELNEGDTKSAANIATKYMKDELHIKVDGLTDQQKLALYNDLLHVMSTVSNFVGKNVPSDKRLTAENAMDIIRQATIELAKLKLSDLQKVEVTTTAEKSIEEVVSKAPADEVAQCSTSLINAQNEIIGLANTIQDAALRDKILAQIKDSNSRIALVMVAKLSEGNLPYYLRPYGNRGQDAEREQGGTGQA